MTPPQAILVLGLAASAQAPDSAASDGITFFEARIRPLLAARCYKCHSVGAERLRGGLRLDSHAGWARGGDSGPAIAPGEPERSLLIRAIRYLDSDLQMPPDGKLSEREIADLVAWVARGAPDPRGEEPTASRTKKRVIHLDEERNHWAYRPLPSSPPPGVKDAAWCRTPIDRFILAKLEEKGVGPSPLADRRRIIRRASFGLTGLPPSPAAVKAFERDSSPDALERMIDRLLASPGHGERWARHWLDLARFAESHGFEHDTDRPHAYPYRDFLIRAFNSDLPHDELVRLQLAGDEIDPGNPLALMATGFLAAGVHSTQITKNQVEKERYDELDDMLSTAGTAFLGLTLGCARCHDHKFDPISTEEYYRLLATFTTTVRSEMDVDMDPQAHAQALAAFTAAHAPHVETLARFEREELPRLFDAWLDARLKGRPGDDPQADWLVLEVEKSESKGGAAFTTLEDGSLLAGGKNPDQDTQVFTARTGLTGITAIRLEALSHASLVKGGPGRAANGNFALTDLGVAAAPLAGSGAAVELKLRNPRATFEQKGLGVAGAIDGDKSSAWAVDPQFGKDHVAAFETDPAGFDGGTLLTFTLEFKNNTGHGIGRPRLSLSTASAPASIPLDGASAPERVARTLAAMAAGGTPPSPEDRAFLPKWYRTREPAWRELKARVEEHEKLRPRPRLEKVLISSEGVPPVRLNTQGEDFFPETYFLRRGDPSQKLGAARQGFLRALGSTPEHDRRWCAPPPAGWRTSHRRWAMARWITDVDDGAGRLLARVIVNRLWQHHLGRGIVSTPSDFGTQGARPTHPELLDWLAGELIRGGWRLKPIHRLILASAVQTQASDPEPRRAAADPDNKLFWRRASIRLEAEAIRDSILAASGTIDGRMYGPGTLDPGHRRRSLYFTVKRSALVPMMTLFDAPDALQGIALRPATTIAPQALCIMNSPFVRSAAAAFASRIIRETGALVPGGPVDAAVSAAYRIALGREPEAGELSEAAAFLRSQKSSYEADPGVDRARLAELAFADYCHALLGLNEFVYVD